MKTFNDCLREANVPEYPSRETSTHEWIFYSNGSVSVRMPSKLADTNELARLKKLFPAHEKIKLVDMAYDLKVDEYNAAYQKATSLWDAALREEYAHIPDAIFNVCYSMAYEKGHHAGHDEVANCMIYFVDFSAAIIEAWRHL